MKFKNLNLGFPMDPDFSLQIYLEHSPIYYTILFKHYPILYFCF